jgi:hypothetical protein
VVVQKLKSIDLIVNIITPVGSTNGLQKTIRSVQEVSSKLNKIKFNHILVLNNNIIELNDIDSKEYKNLNLQILDINPIASRSAARNYAIKSIENYDDNSFVIFLDAGDLLLSEALEKIQKKYYYELKNNSLFINNSYLQLNSKKKLTHIPLYPLRLRRIVNPFLLGGIILSTNLSKKSSFYEGRKEDWIYWNDIIDLNPQIYREKEFNYIYNIENQRSHYKNKYKSILSLRDILINKLKWGSWESYFIFILHFLLITIRWIYLNIKTII